MHGDIRPRNLRFNSKGNVILCDFDIFEIDDDFTRCTRDKVYFLAPEVFKTGDHVRSMDIWACGITLFNMLTGAYPFEGKNIMSLQANILTEEANLEKIKDPRIKEIL